MMSLTGICRFISDGESIIAVLPDGKGGIITLPVKTTPLLHHLAASREICLADMELRLVVEEERAGYLWVVRHVRIMPSGTVIFLAADRNG